MLGTGQYRLAGPGVEGVSGTYEGAVVGTPVVHDSLQGSFVVVSSLALKVQLPLHCCHVLRRLHPRPRRAGESGLTSTRTDVRNVSTGTATCADR